MVRLLVAAPDAYTREALVRAAGTEAVSTGLEYLPNAVRTLQPEALVLDAGGDTEATRHHLERARGAAESALPALLLLSANSLWLRGAAPASVLPCIVLQRTVQRTPISSGLSRLSGLPPSGIEEAGDAFTWLHEMRELRGPTGTVHLTASESSIFATVLEANGGVVSAERLASALWGQQTVDTLSRAAIRSHVYTLRKKLGSAGLADALMSLSGSGYRLHLPRQRHASSGG